MSQSITAVRPLIANGAVVAVGGTATVSDQQAADFVWRGDATYTSGAPAQSVTINTDVNINTAQIADSTTVGKAVLTAASAGAAQTALGAGAQGASVFGAATFDALLTAMGASLGAADSGGTGYKAIRVPNATT